MYLEIRSEGLGNQCIVVGPFSNESARSTWRADFFKEVDRINKGVVNEDHLLTASIADAEEIPKRGNYTQSKDSIDNIVSQLASLLD